MMPHERQKAIELLKNCTRAVQTRPNLSGRQSGTQRAFFFWKITPHGAEKGRLVLGVIIRSKVGAVWIVEQKPIQINAVQRIIRNLNTEEGIGRNCCMLDREV